MEDFGDITHFLFETGIPLFYEKLGGKQIPKELHSTGILGGYSSDLRILTGEDYVRCVLIKLFGRIRQ